MTTSDLRISAAAPARSFGPRPKAMINGFPSRGLVSLMRFAGSLANDQPGGAAGVLTGSGAYQSGGGISLSGLASVAAPVIDVTQPWTLIAGVTLPPPAATGSSGRRSLMRLAADYPARGMHVFNEQPTGQPITANALHGLYWPISLDGSEVSPYPSINYDRWAARYSHPQTIVMRHHGGGSLSLQQRVPGDFGQTTCQITINALRGGPGDLVALQATIFGSYFSFANGSAIYDAAAAYSVCLTPGEVSLWQDAHETLAATRGRS